jgi:hypothetical protein
VADKKGVILIRFPEALADKLRRVSLESNTPIKDIVSEIVENNLDEWRRQHAIAALKETTIAIASLQAKIEKYAANRSISFDQASDELGITEVIAKAMTAIEAIQSEAPDKTGKKGKK